MPAAAWRLRLPARPSDRARVARRARAPDPGRHQRGDAADRQPRAARELTRAWTHKAWRPLFFLTRAFSSVGPHVRMGSDRTCWAKAIEGKLRGDGGIGLRVSEQHPMCQLIALHRSRRPKAGLVRIGYNCASLEWRWFRTHPPETWRD